jgi:hypothetical protein
MLSRPLFRTVLPLKPPRKHETHARTHAFAGLGPDEVSGPARESMAPSTQEYVCVGTSRINPTARLGIAEDWSGETIWPR